MATEDPQNAAIPQVMGWQRRGECNGCGWCCQSLGFSTFALKGASDDRYLRLRGFERRPDGTYAAQVIVLSPCREHDAANRMCLVYAGRPSTCRTFPSNPEQIEGSPCTYWFERLRDGRVERRGGDGAPCR